MYLNNRKMTNHTPSPDYQLEVSPVLIVFHFICGFSLTCSVHVVCFAQIDFRIR